MTVRSHADSRRKQRISGDTADRDRAFAGHVREFKGLVFRIALAVLRDAGEAEEVAQDVFLRAYRKLDTLRSADRFRSWAARIAYRQALNRRRGCERRKRRERDWHAVRPTTTSGHAEGHVLAGELRRGLESLPDRLRDVLLLSAVEGLAPAEIGDLLAIPPGTVRSRLHQARRRMLEMME